MMRLSGRYLGRNILSALNVVRLLHYKAKYSDYSSSVNALQRREARFSVPRIGSLFPEAPRLHWVLKKDVQKLQYLLLVARRKDLESHCELSGFCYWPSHSSLLPSL